jgi:hypothetical protein
MWGIADQVRNEHGAHEAVPKALPPSVLSPNLEIILYSFLKTLGLSD